MTKCPRHSIFDIPRFDIRYSVQATHEGGPIPRLRECSLKRRHPTSLTLPLFDLFEKEGLCLVLHAPMSRPLREIGCLPSSGLFLRGLRRTGHLEPRIGTHVAHPGRIHRRFGAGQPAPLCERLVQSYQLRSKSRVSAITCCDYVLRLRAAITCCDYVLRLREA